MADKKIEILPFSKEMADRYTGRTPFSQRWGLPAMSRPSSPQVYVGTMADSRGNVKDTFEPIDDARLRYTAFTPEEAKKFYSLKNAMYPNKWGQPSNENFWKDLINGAAYALNNGERITPFEVGLRQLAQMQKAGLVGRTGGGSGSKKYTGPVTSDTVSESINLTDPTTARGLIDQALEQTLGRKATSREQQRFVEALNRAEQEAPSVTEQVSVSTPQGPGKASTRQKSVTRSPMDRGVFAEEYAAAQEGAGEFKTATTALSAFMDAIKGIG